mmetsp:Transcript_4860/g.10685  ORF Transcript_4860/g.10685 Transcript_4860/m.10685 type:complete len:277 (-) Transcript_4860:511-1341(-)
MAASAFPFCFDPRGSNIFQKRNASSAPADNTVDSSGARASPKTRPLCPVNVANFWKLGYRQTFNSLFTYPCPDTNSLSCGFQTNALTCDPLSVEAMHTPLVAFHNLICLSAVPPPVARRPRFQGHHAMAFTAALCSRNDHLGTSASFSHTWTTLSFPPVASAPASDQSNPHTSPSCASSFFTRCSRMRTSWRWSSPVLLPLARIGPHHPTTPTRSPCPRIHRSWRCCAASYSCTVASSVPTAKCPPSCVHLMEVTALRSPSTVHSSSVRPSEALHM